MLSTQGLEFSAFCRKTLKLCVNVHRMGASDNIHTGKSTFMVELMVHDNVHDYVYAWGNLIT